MSRTSGTYTAPASTWNPAVAGTAIDEGDWNDLLTDIEAALTESTYTAATTGTDNAIVRMDGTDGRKVQGSSASIDDNGSLVVPAGSAAAPTVTKSGDTNTGLFFPAADKVALTTGGTKRIEFSDVGTVGVNVDAQAQSAATFRIDNPASDTTNATRLTVANTAGHRAAISQSTAYDHISMAMGYEGTTGLEDRWGVGMSGIAFYPFQIEHGYTAYGGSRTVQNPHHGKVGVWTGTTTYTTTAIHPLTVGQSPYDAFNNLRATFTAPVITTQMIGAYNAGACYITGRNTTDNIECIFGATTASVIFGSSTAHNLSFRVNGTDYLTFNGSALYPVSTGTVSLGTSSLLYGDTYTQGNTYQKETALTLSSTSGTIQNQTLPTGTWLTITNATGAFALGGLTGGSDGRMVTIYNSTANNMTFNNEDAGSTAANRILTMTGANVALTGVSVATLRYSAVSSRWILVGTQG